MSTVEAPPITAPETQQGSPRASAWVRIWKDPVARISIIILFILYMSAFLAGPLAPYSMDFNDPELGNSPPTTVHYFDEKGALCQPFVYKARCINDADTFSQFFEEVQRTVNALSCFQTSYFKIQFI